MPIFARSAFTQNGVKRFLLSLVLVACSSSAPIDYVACPQGGPLVSILVGDEHLYGTASITAQQDLSGSGALAIVVCGTSANDDIWRLQVNATSYLAPDASTPPPLPLTSTSELDLPTANASAGISAQLHGTPRQSTVTSAQITASAGVLHGSVIAADAGVATFDGNYVFGCATNEPDPHFLTSFCKQFEALAAP